MELETSAGEHSSQPQETKVSIDAAVESSAPNSNSEEGSKKKNDEVDSEASKSQAAATEGTQAESQGAESGDGVTSGGEGEKMETVQNDSQGEGVNGEGTPAHKKRNRTRDDLSLSPDLTKTGKRQRKTNSLYSGYAIDKKTSHILETETVAAPHQEETSSVGAPPSDSLGKKEVLLTPLDAQVKAKKLPKGYAYEPVFVPAVVKDENLPPKRERKKQSAAAAKPSKKQKTSKQPKKQAPPTKKANSPSPSGAPATDEVTAQMLKKQELENQLSALTQQLAMVSQTLETKTKQVQALEKLEKTDVVKEERADSDDGEMEIALPSGTIIRQKKKQPASSKKAKRTSSVYDRFESDDDLPIPKKAGKRNTGKVKDTGVRPQRSSKKKSLVDDDSEEDVPTSSAAPPPGTVKSETVDESLVSENLRGCLKLVLTMRKHHYAWPFNNPVDPVALQLPDYLDIIKQPMDFGTVLDKLKTSKYSAVDEFGDDMRLVFKNALTYNQPGSDICVMATTLSNSFERQFSRLSGKSMQSPKVTSASAEGSSQEVGAAVLPAEDPNSKTKAEMANTINELRDSMKFVREEISKLRREKAATSSPAVHAPRARAPQRPKEEPLREMTFDEKRQLSFNINSLQPEALGKVVQIIHQRMPNLAQNSPDEIEIDIDALDTGTLRALEKYVKQCLAKKKVKRNAPLPKHLQAEQTAQNTSKSIQDVKKKLKELTDKTGGVEKKPKKKKEEDTEEVDIDDDAPARTYPTVEITKDKMSSSSSSSDTSSSSSDSSSSESESEKPQGAAPVASTTSAPAAAVESVATSQAEKPEQDQRDASLPSPEREPTKMEGVTHTQAPDTKNDAESPQILPAAVKKGVELKNLDSWTNLAGMDPSTEASQNQKKDETWSQFQNRDLQNKQREKEREEQQEKEKREKAEREAERRRLEEQRAKEIAEQEQKKLQEEEESKMAAQRDLAAKRAAERKAREQLSANSINMLDQSMIMSSFEKDGEM